MYTTLLSLALLASTALAQIPGLPTCAQGCITNYGGCNQVDVKCICSNKPLLATLSCCVSQNCDAQGQADVISFADSLCSGQGVNDLPTKATCASGASSTGTATGSSSGSGTMSMTSAAASSSASAASSSAAAQTTSSAAAAPGKVYPVEGVGLGMAVLGLVVGL
ncbi:hypothetical protein PRZ48_008253 [Zasmidium cellare]|uniref:CFEM domain-containing protein n=1 Tax=Zasmidium cellare TaxID=395010 RepID=A0ABR0EF06_ZASCE|nr:hypothetical protein PRZ48_008253 [Zasmidium cellare]